MARAATSQGTQAGRDPAQLRREAGQWLKRRREQAGLTQASVAEHLGLRYYTFVSQVEGGHGRVPSDQMEAWATVLGVPPAHFARTLLRYYDPDMYRLLFGTEIGDDDLPGAGVSGKDGSRHG